LLLKKGAEADLYLEEWHGRRVIIKRRLPKGYRAPELDEEIRFQRTIHEPQIIHRAKEAGVPTPTILMVDVAEATIIMEYVDGEQVKRILDGLPPDRKTCLCRLIGKLVGRLHRNGIIHGDLTTSNMILTSNNSVVFVDFGLSEISTELEARGVDLHLMRRAFQSTHYRDAKESLATFFEGYSEVVGEDTAKEVLKKIRDIERRGRYVER